METDDPQHDRQGPGKYVELRMDFMIPDGVENDEDMHVLAAVQMHAHHVPNGAMVDAFLAVAVNLVKQGMVESMFNEHVPEEVRNHAAAVLAQKFLVDRLRSGELAVDSFAVNVPDDASELFDE
jgi:hypothetical protein